MKIILSLLLFLTFTGFVIRGQAAQNNLAPLSQAAPWLSLPMDARSAGMGNAFGAIADDVSTLDINPAGLPLLSGPQILLMHNQWFQDVAMERGVFGMPLGNGGLGFSFDYLNYGSIDGYTLNASNLPVASGSVNANGFNGKVGYGFPLAENFYVGASAGYLTQTLGGTSQGAFNGDAGLLWRNIVPGVSAGLAAQNFGQQLNGYSLGTNVDFSLAYKSPVFNQTHSFNLDVDTNIPTDGASVGWDFGAEYWLAHVLALRAGEQVSNDRIGSGLSGLSLGAGLAWGQLEFDYAFSDNGDLGNSNLFSLTYCFEGQKDKVKIRAKDIDVKVQIQDVKLGTLKLAVFDFRFVPRTTDVTGWTFNIFDKNSKIIRSYQGRGIPPRELSWDGKDDNGNIVQGGIFATYKFQSLNSREEQVESTQTIFQSIAAPLREANILDSMKRNVQFEKNSADLDPIFMTQLSQLASVLLQQPLDHVLLVGYSSNEGTEDYNLDLSRQRAMNVRDYLLSKGINQSQIDVLGKGSADPLLPNDTEEGRNKNRRVEIKIVPITPAADSKGLVVPPVSDIPQN
jgi:outer membrane protein OmpA-like peptidoglycan-associated protein